MTFGKLDPIYEMSLSCGAWKIILFSHIGIACPWFTMTKWRFLFIFQIYWLKDRVEVQPERDSNYIQAADGHLIIIQAREKDRANYTCVAENVANRRLSPPARLNVHGKTFSEKKGHLIRAKQPFAAKKKNKTFLKWEEMNNCWLLLKNESACNSILDTILKVTILWSSHYTIVLQVNGIFANLHFLVNWALSASKKPIYCKF